MVAMPMPWGTPSVLRPLRPSLMSLLDDKESKEWLQGVVDSAADAIIAMDEQQNIVLFNKSAATIFLISQADAIGKPFAALLAERPRDHDIAAFAASGHSAASVGRRANGDEFPVEVTVSQAILGGRTVTTAILRDVSQQAQSDKEADTHHTTISQMPIGFVVFEAVLDAAGNVVDFRYIEVNPSFEKHTGLPRDAVIGRTILEVPSLVADWLESYTKVAATGESAHFESFVKSLNRWFDITAFRLSGNTLGVAFVDSSARRRSMQQVLHLQKMEALGRLAGGIAHDFNNLMTIVRGSVELAMSGGLGPERIQANLRTVIEAVDRGTALVKQLMVFSRQRTPTEFAPVNIADLLDEVERMVPRLIGEHVRMVVHRAPNLDPVLGDHHQLFQVLVNIILNAKDAMPDGGKITIATKMEVVDEHDVRMNRHAKAGHYVRLSVTDTGTGMTPDVKARMFDPFFTTKAEGKGTGLGLSLVQGIMQAVGGHVNVYSEIGRGTVVNLYFPSMAQSQRRQAALEDANLNGAVLVVEDEMALRHIVCEVLVAHGYSVLEATNGREAIEVATRHPDKIAIIVSDMVMPTMGGIEMLKHIRPLLRPDLGVVLMSGYNEFAERLDDDKLIRTLRKPFAMNDMLAAIRELATKRAA